MQVFALVYRNNCVHHLFGQMVKVFGWRAADLDLMPVFPVGIFSGFCHSRDLKKVATLPGTCRIESVLGLVGMVSVYCD